MNLSSKNVLITGGSMGIGKAAVRACLEADANVVICARGKDDIERTVAEFQADGFADKVAGITADVSSERDIERALDFVENRYGAVNGVIHAAGIYGPIGSILDISPTEWFDAIRINLFGAFLVTRQAGRRMRNSGGGRIALYSGGGGGTPFPYYTAYASSKVAIVRFTESIAVELAPDNIEVNCIAPGFVATRLHQQTVSAGTAAGGEFLEKTKAVIENGGVSPDVGGKAAAFFISDLAKGITGKFVAAPYDGYTEWPQHLSALQDSELFTLRRILPKERGMDWQ